MPWLLILVAGLLEVGWAIGLKTTDGFTRPLPTLLTAAALILSMVCLALAVRTLPMGTAYAVWTGIGIVGTSLLGIWLFGESAHPMRLLFITLILAGIAGLKLWTPPNP
jgi:quaternary ammonium compound-resistance protein SugE